MLTQASLIAPPSPCFLLSILRKVEGEKRKKPRENERIYKEMGGRRLNREGVGGWRTYERKRESRRERECKIKREAGKVCACESVCMRKGKTERARTRESANK